TASVMTRKARTGTPRAAAAESPRSVAYKGRERRKAAHNPAPTQAAITPFCCHVTPPRPPKPHNAYALSCVASLKYCIRLITAPHALAIIKPASKSDAESHTRDAITRTSAIVAAAPTAAAAA